jgi:ribosomal protein L6P/L9E
MLNKNFCFLLNHYYFKKIFIDINIKLKIFYLNTQKFLIISKNLHSFFLIIPSFINLNFKNNFLYLTINIKNFLKNSFKYILRFVNNLLFNIKYLNKEKFITFFLRGVGLKINFKEMSSSILFLKFGYSHPIYLNLPNNIFISFFKRKIILYSYNRMFFGNFINILYKYRPINVFTGKGLLQKKKKLKLKEYTKKI